MERLLAKSIEGVEIEIVLVESNSTDGTREDARRFGDHPSVRLILQDRPRGRGFAVREGLAACTGDMVLFQDADLEYDDPISWIRALMRFRWSRLYTDRL
jgi:glycosyltransferase involved in cell wall biosynthesis